MQDIGLAAQGPTMFSSTGALNYSIPIVVPKGRGGISPNLSIAYNSYQGNSWLGVGFVLDMGAIRRATNNQGGVDYSSGSKSFQAVVNGSVSNLVPVDAEWGADHFENQIDGAFLNYYYNSSSNYWQVTDKNGTIYYYGCTAGAYSQQNNSYGTFSWFLDKVVDINGNYMNVTYQQDQGHVYLYRIDYTGNTNGTVTTNYVLFNRISRSDVLTSYASYAADTTASLLGSIDVHATDANGNDVRARTYQLNYGNTGVSSLSILQSVTQYGGDGTSFLPGVTFNWVPETLGFASGWSRGNVHNNYYGYQVVDVNGDGKSDIIYDYNVTGSSSQFWVMLSKGNGFAADAKWGTRTASYNSKCQFFRLADINKDGLPDLVYIDSNNKIHVLLNNGNGFGSDTIISGVSAAPESGFQLADVTGDGVPDLVYDQNGQFHVLIGDGQGGFTAGFSVPRATGYNTGQKTFHMADLNGDGLADIVYLDNSENIHVLLSTGSGFQGDAVWGQCALGYPNAAGASTPPPFILADLNGDGLADFVYLGLKGAQAEFRMLRSRGKVSPSDNKGFDPEVSLGTAYFDNGVNGIFAFQLADINGDGMPDLVYADAIWEGVNDYDFAMYALVNTGSGFTAAQQLTGASPAYQVGDYLGLSFGDFNGDGIWDLVYEHDAGVFTVLPASGPVPDHISGILNGIGGSYTINYTPSSAWPTGTNDPNPQNPQQAPRPPFALQTVSSVSAKDGNGNTSATNYAYSGGYYDLATREFRGFSCVNQQLQSGSVVEGRFRTDDIFKGLMYEQTTWDANGNEYQDQNNTLQDYFPNNPPAGVHYPYVAQMEVKTFDAGEACQDTVTAFSYDQYGNLLTRDQVERLNSPGEERYDQIDYIYDTSRWLLARPADVIIRSSPTGPALSMTSFSYYFGTNLVSSKGFWLDGGRDPEIFYTYDSYGNVLTQTDPMGNVTTTTYDPVTSTFPQTVTNAKGQSGTIAYNYQYGKPATKTDPNGAVTQHQYDVYGRLTTVIGPGDTQQYTTKSYNYNDSLLGTIGANNGGQHVTVQARVQSLQSAVYTTSTYFDGFGREISTRSDGPLGSSNQVSVDTLYDQNGKVYQKSYPYFVGLENVRYITYYYDSLGRMTKKANPDGTSTSMAYSGNLTTVTDPNGNQTAQQRDVFGRVTQVTELAPSGPSTLYQYDTLGNLILVQPAQGEPTSIAYDSLSRKVQMTDPAMGTWFYS
jgi:YD repeat-containing protein